MSMNDMYRGQTVPTGRADMAVDAGLRSFMLGVYSKMATGLGLAAALAFATASVPVLRDFFLTSPMIFVVMFGPLALLLISAFVMKNPSPVGANLIYWPVVSLIGIGMGAMLLRFGSMPDGMFTVAKAFLTTSAAFGALSLWGYTTKRDLSGWGVFLMMGLFGLIIASLVNFGFAAFTGAPISGLSFVISILGVLIFAGFTAYDTQQLKYSYYAYQGDGRSLAVATTYGALNLFINFVNLFQFILSLMSNND
jgi:uncharacterized protein